MGNVSIFKAGPMGAIRINLDAVARMGTDRRIRYLLLIRILLLSHSLIFFRFIFYQYMVVFLFNTVIYVFLL